LNPAPTGHRPPRRFGARAACLFVAARWLCRGPWSVGCIVTGAPWSEVHVSLALAYIARPNVSRHFHSRCFPAPSLRAVLLLWLPAIPPTIPTETTQLGSAHGPCPGHPAPPWVLPPCHHSPVTIPIHTRSARAAYPERCARDPLLNQHLIVRLEQARVNIIVRHQLRLLLR
jgi:hypothetical protein